ncbi:pre-miRNA 5'-monophosphate methyltransferase-like [Daphnia carinata]|uniref:pre-miRNA 5'-monophosphate methyltransferase-like n=1 Tax=Daphnia carinata TaxID=120202 RepID=UPI0025808567|nr:pre-miRNA 5'-monophosphate methyltransferase-like [Daphnia carinata]
MEPEKKNDEFEPGAAQFGNFITYYKFNPPENRLAVFEGNFCEYFSSHQPLLCLDVGCNTGDLTKGLYEMLSSGRSAVRMMGVDLDAQLVERANEAISNELESKLQFHTLDFVAKAEERNQLLSRYLETHQSGRKRFDIAFCFSTTMWVHLNHGDAGLESLLASLAAWADNVVIEPQPWKCYRNATRRRRRANLPPFPSFGLLVHRENVVAHIKEVFCNGMDMELQEHLGQSEWQRPVLWYRHKPTTNLAI